MVMRINVSFCLDSGLQRFHLKEAGTFVMQCFAYMIKVNHILRHLLINI